MGTPVCASIDVSPGAAVMLLLSVGSRAGACRHRSSVRTHLVAYLEANCPPSRRRSRSSQGSASQWSTHWSGFGRRPEAVHTAASSAPGASHPTPHSRQPPSVSAVEHHVHTRLSGPTGLRPPRWSGPRWPQSSLRLTWSSPYSSPWSASRSSPRWSWSTPWSAARRFAALRAAQVLRLAGCKLGGLRLHGPL